MGIQFWGGASLINGETAVVLGNSGSSEDIHTDYVTSNVLGGRSRYSDWSTDWTEQNSDSVMQIPSSIQKTHECQASLHKIRGAWHPSLRPRKYCVPQNKSQQDRQYTYNLILRCVRVTTVAVEKH